jgi:uncharacterized integral membrane protein
MRDLWLAGIAGVLLFLMLVVGIVANAQDIREHEHLSVAGKFYAGWLMPNQGKPRMTSCCDNRDCYQTAIKKVGAYWYARRREDGQWILILVRLILGHGGLRLP